MTILALSWSTSRGHDTYGYNICRLDDRDTGRRFKCMGGGYDMVGTVVGEWLQERYQDRLRAMASSRPQTSAGYHVASIQKIEGLYGLSVYEDGSVHLDGACGLSSIEGIADAIGLCITPSRDRKGRTTLFFVSATKDIA